MLTRRKMIGAGIGLGVAAGSRPLSAQPKADDTLAPGARRDVLIRWGDRVEFDSPPFDPAAMTIEAAATQFGWDARVLGLLMAQPGEDNVARALLAVAHPEVQARMAFPGGADRPAVAAAMQGASLINLERRGDRWVVVDGGFQSRRLTGSTLCRLSGPATGVAGDAIQGVLAIGGGCATPWGTLLLGEGDPQPWFARLRDADDRFPHSAHAKAYGWMVELDAFDPQALPVKRTALGRFARGGAAAALSADGRAVVFMSDARPQGGLFRFVSQRRVADDPTTALDSGTLSVAVIDGLTLRFVRLPGDAASLLDTAEAARRVNASMFDQPAGLAVGPSGVLSLACRGVAQRLVPDVLNPRRINPDGHVLAFRPDGGDVAADIFGGEIVMLGGDPRSGGGVAQEGASSFVSRPSAVAVAGSGQLWIVGESGLAVTDSSGLGLRQVYAPPAGAEMSGVAIAADGTVMTAVAHPGALPGASFDRPATRWPSLRPPDPPRSTVIAVRV